MLIIDVDLIKSYLENNIVKKVIWNGYYISKLVAENELLWYHGYKGYLDYRELEDGTLAVSALDSYILPSDIVIPSSYGGKTVTIFQKQISHI